MAVRLLRRIPLYLAILATAALLVSAEEVEEEPPFTLFAYSLSAPYIEEQLQNRWWDFGGDTIMEVNNYIRLTPDRGSKAGYLWAKHPFTTKSWMTEFEFKVHSTTSGLHGDGFAFWYTSEKNTRGPVFGSKDKFSGLGVFFDTFNNGRHALPFPRVNAMVGDGKTAYDYKDGVTGQVGSCELDFRNKEDPTWARVKYVQETKRLQVWSNAGNAGRRDEDFKLCFQADNVVLPPSGYIGFSAHTGGVSDNHDIISVKTQAITVRTKPNSASSNQDTAKGPSAEKVPTYYADSKMDSTKATSKSSSGFVEFLKVLFGLAALGAVCTGAWMYAQRQQERSFKRF